MPYTFISSDRSSNDVDVELRFTETLKPKRNEIENAVGAIDFDDENDDPKTIVFDGSFNPTLGLLDPEYENRAESIYQTNSKLIRLYLVSAVELAVSKLGRYETNDRQDIINLYQNQKFTLKEFKEVAAEALSYCGASPNKVEFNIKMAIKLLEEKGL